MPAPLPLVKVLALAEHLTVIGQPVNQAAGTEEIFYVPAGDCRKDFPSINIADLATKRREEFNHDIQNAVKLLKIMADKPEPPARTIEATLQQRGGNYGSFVDNAGCAQRIKAAYTSGKNWAALPSDMREALEIIASKISRMLTGNPNHADNWHDIAGYAVLIEQRLLKDQKDQNHDTGRNPAEH